MLSDVKINPMCAGDPRRTRADRPPQRTLPLYKKASQRLDLSQLCAVEGNLQQPSINIDPRVPLTQGQANTNKGSTVSASQKY